MSTSTPPFIVSFYDSQTSLPDASGRTLETILHFSNAQLEHHHDFIQYLFPLPERSPVNPRAPVITQAVRETFLATAELRAQLRRSLVRMLEFYGFDATMQPSEDFKSRAGDSWLVGFDHNHLRITRIIRSLRVLGLEEEAKQFQRALVENDARGVVSSRSKAFWARAAERPLYLAPEVEDERAEGVVWLRAES